MKRRARSVMCVSAVASLLVAGCMTSGDPEADAGPLLDAPAFDSALDANRLDGHAGDARIGADGGTGDDGGVPIDAGDPIDGSESMIDAGDRTDVGADGGAMMDARAPVDCAAATVHSCDVPSTVDGASSVGSCGAVGNCEYTCRGGRFVVTRNTCDVPTATFGVTRTIETWTVPTTGSYFISAIGGRGGTGGNTIRTGGGEAGGYPVRAEGTFELVRGQVLRIAVGEDGSPGLIFTPGGGGGASFVVLESGMPLVVAGGGGGGGFGDAPIAQQGLDASSATNGTAANCGGSASAPGGTDGHGGGAVSGSDSSGAGGGLLTAGDGCGGGQAFVDGAAGGFCSARAGGFGGGGGGGGGGAGGGGGGGGYSGGGGGSLASVSCGGGGGGSFVAPSATSASITARGGITSGVTIRFLRPDRIDFAETGSMASWVVPESGVYVIHGRGGSTGLGRAADAVGAFALLAGDTLDILVGDLGYGGGGAGGTFVVRRAAEPIPLVVAGGAGGGGGIFSSDASLTTSGNPGQPGARAGGSDGAGGLSELPVGYGGGGFVTDGVGAFGGRSFLNGGLGGAGAGFGGGGGCVMFSGAGGGGGYSGGGGGRDTGGGGGSYVSSLGVGAEITLAAPLRAPGFVTILLP